METCWMEGMIASQAIRELMFEDGKLRSEAGVYKAVLDRYGPQSDPDSIRKYVRRKYANWIGYFQTMEANSRDPSWSQMTGNVWGPEEFKKLCPDWQGVLELLDRWYCGDEHEDDWDDMS